MKYNYNKLWKKLIDLQISKTEMRISTGISTVALAKMGKGQQVSMDTLSKICEFLNCQLGDIVEIEFKPSAAGMTIKKLKEMYKGQYTEIEVYESTCDAQHYPTHFHTDNCRGIEQYNDNSIVGLYEFMNEEDYNNTIMANSSENADFSDWYGDKDAIVLCIMLK